MKQSTASFCSGQGFDDPIGTCHNGSVDPHDRLEDIIDTPSSEVAAMMNATVTVIHVNSVNKRSLVVRKGHGNEITLVVVGRLQDYILNSSRQDCNLKVNKTARVKKVRDG